MALLELVPFIWVIELFRDLNFELRHLRNQLQRFLAKMAVDWWSALQQPGDTTRRFRVD